MNRKLTYEQWETLHKRKMKKAALDTIGLFSILVLPVAYMLLDYFMI